MKKLIKVFVIVTSIALISTMYISCAASTDSQQTVLADKPKDENKNTTNDDTIIEDNTSKNEDINTSDDTTTKNNENAEANNTEEELYYQYWAVIKLDEFNRIKPWTDDSSRTFEEVKETAEKLRQCKPFRTSWNEPDCGEKTLAIRYSVIYDFFDRYKKEAFLREKRGNMIIVKANDKYPQENRIKYYYIEKIK